MTFDVFTYIMFGIIAVVFTVLVFGVLILPFWYEVLKPSIYDTHIRPDRSTWLKLALLIVALLLLAVSVSAQTERRPAVILMDAADAAEAKRVYKAMTHAEFEWALFRQHVEAKYTITDEKERASIESSISRSRTMEACEQREDDPMKCWTNGSLTLTGTVSGFGYTRDYHRLGWFNGFTFSDDFRHIIAKEASFTLTTGGVK